jgi:hypothetical protein
LPLETTQEATKLSLLNATLQRLSQASRISLSDHDEKVSEEIEFEQTKETLIFKWYEEPEDWDWLCPADDDINMGDMKTRQRELYSSCLRLDKVKKMTTTKNNDKISSDQKKEIQGEARRVGLLLKQYDSFWTEQGWSSARKSSGLSKKTSPKEAQTTSPSTSGSYKKPRPTTIQSRRLQTGLGKSDEFPLSSPAPLTPLRTQVT